MLECPDIDFYTRAELDVGSSEVPISTEPSIEQAGNRCHPGVMEGVLHTLNAEWRTKMILKWAYEAPVQSPHGLNAYDLIISS